MEERGRLVTSGSYVRRCGVQKRLKITERLASCGGQACQPWKDATAPRRAGQTPSD